LFNLTQLPPLPSEILADLLLNLNDIPLFNCQTKFTANETNDHESKHITNDANLNATLPINSNVLIFFIVVITIIISFTLITLLIFIINSFRQRSCLSKSTTRNVEPKNENDADCFNCFHQINQNQIERSSNNANLSKKTLPRLVPGTQPQNDTFSSVSTLKSDLSYNLNSQSSQIQLLNRPKVPNLSTFNHLNSKCVFQPIDTESNANQHYYESIAETSQYYFDCEHNGAQEICNNAALSYNIQVMPVVIEQSALNPRFSGSDLGRRTLNYAHFNTPYLKSHLV
jgi:hypothetical protein